MKVDFDYFIINDCLANKFHLFREEMLYLSGLLTCMEAKQATKRKRGNVN